MNTKYNILDVVPHGPPMCLLDDVIQFDEQSLEAKVTIHPDSMFCEESGVPAWVGIEYMGQAIAAWAGVQAREQGNPVKIGFLVSCRKYDSPLSHFSVGSELRVSIQQVTEDTTGLQVFSCKIQGDEFEIEANLNVFLPEDATAFLYGEIK